MLSLLLLFYFFMQFRQKKKKNLVIPHLLLLLLHLLLRLLLLPSSSFYLYPFKVRQVSPVAELWFDQVSRAESEGEEELRADDAAAKEPTRLSQFHEGHQVHSLVLGLLQQRVDPALVASHETQRLEMTPRGGRHARDAGHRFQENAAL